MVKKKLCRIAVIDGQGGGIGSQIVGKISRSLPAIRFEIIALGTNAIAANTMLKAGANEAASGENAIVYTVRHVELLLGTIGILTPYGFSGEMTPAAAEAVNLSPVPKFVLHLNRAGIEVTGCVSEPLPHLVDMLAERVYTYLGLKTE